MTRSLLNRIATGEGWTPSEWQLLLADQIGGNAVRNIFRHAELVEDEHGRRLRIPARLQANAAPHMPEVRRVLEKLP